MAQCDRGFQPVKEVRTSLPLNYCVVQHSQFPKPFGLQIVIKLLRGPTFAVFEVIQARFRI